jgi:hypothetical protein
MEPRERQSHHIEIASLDPSNVASGTALNGVPTGLIEWLAARDVRFNFPWFE